MLNLALTDMTETKQGFKLIAPEGKETIYTRLAPLVRSISAQKLYTTIWRDLKARGETVIDGYTIKLVEIVKNKHS